LIGPVESGLGPALFRVNAVLEASEVTFEEAREDLTAELSASAAIRAVDDARDDYEDLLAGGATLEELANESDMILGQIDWLPTSEDQIAAYEAFREIAAVATERDFPELFELSDGGLFALRLDEIVPPTVQPFDQARDAAEAGWQAEQLRDRVTARAFDLVAGLDSSSSLETLPLTVTQEQQIRRQDFVPDAPPTLVAQVFQQSEVGDVVVIPGADTAWIVRLDRINAAVRTNETTTLLLNIVQTQAAQSIAQDVFEAFGQALESDIGIRLDPAMINAVHATLP
jgi:peptidyl-prolyl cis-trans isomerase D